KPRGNNKNQLLCCEPARRTKKNRKRRERETIEEQANAGAIPEPRTLAHRAGAEGSGFARTPRTPNRNREGKRQAQRSAGQGRAGCVTTKEGLELGIRERKKEGVAGWLAASLELSLSLSLSGRESSAWELRRARSFIYVREDELCSPQAARR